MYSARAPFEAQIGKLWPSDKIMKFHKCKYISIVQVLIAVSRATRNTQVDDHSKKGRCGDPKVPVPMLCQLEVDASNSF